MDDLKKNSPQGLPNRRSVLRILGIAGTSTIIPKPTLDLATIPSGLQNASQEIVDMSQLEAISDWYSIQQRTAGQLAFIDKSIAIMRSGAAITSDAAEQIAQKVTRSRMELLFLHKELSRRANNLRVSAPSAALIREQIEHESTHGYINFSSPSEMRKAILDISEMCQKNCGSNGI